MTTDPADLDRLVLLEKLGRAREERDVFRGRERVLVSRIERFETNLYVARDLLKKTLKHLPREHSLRGRIVGFLGAVR